MPSALLEKKGPHRGTRAHPGNPQNKHAKEQKRTQPVESHGHADNCERSGGQLLARSPALHKGRKEEHSSAACDDTEGSNSAENYDGDDSDTTSDDSSSATPISQISYVTRQRASTKAQTNLGKSLNGPSKTTAPKQKTTRSQPEEVQSHMKSRDAAAREVAAAEQQRDTAIREGAYVKARHAARGGSYFGTSQPEGAPRDLGSNDRSSNIAQKLAAALATQDELRITLATLTNEIQNERQARESAEGTADASVEGKRSRKRVKIVVEKSDEDYYENSDEEPYQDPDEESYQDSDEESDEEEVVDTNVSRPVKGYPRGKNVSGSRVLPPLSRKGLPWTTKEDETLLNLRKQGKSWKHIGEDALGRTAKAALDRWGGLRRESLRTEFLQPTKTLSKRVRRIHTTLDLSALVKIGNRNRPWTKEEESTLSSLRAQGKTIKHISGRLPGRTYDATQMHWIKQSRNQHSQAVTASQDLEANEKRNASDHSPFFPVSQLDQDTKEPEFNPGFAVVVPECSKSRTRGPSGSSRQSRRA